MPVLMLLCCSGVISVVDPTALDRETTASIPLVLTARDQASDAMASSLIINVDLDDINDNTPFFSPSSYSASVFEVQMGILVGQFSLAPQKGTELCGPFCPVIIDCALLGVGTWRVCGHSVCK